MRNSICVLGSINMDIVLTVDKMVQAGETILSNDYRKIFGGKGANQAVAAQRLGANVSFIGRIGSDENGTELVKALIEDGIDISNINFSKDAPTGIAIITVDKAGRNSIIVVSGANMEINKESIEQAKDTIIKSKLIISQFEVPTEAIIEAFKIAKENDVITLLNPAPAKEIPEELLRLTDIIIPNESEAFQLTKVKAEDDASIMEASQKLIKNGAKFVIITLGERGAALVSGGRLSVIPAYKVKAIDTTAAGDSFIGALASKLEKADNINFEAMEKAVAFANKVSSIVVQKKGAQPSLPYLEEVIKVYGEVKGINDL